MTSAPTRPVMRYHGGKWKIAEWIVAHLPPHHTYVEPFAGAASVLMRKRPAHSEIINDLSSDVVNVFRVLRDPDRAQRLREMIELTPFAREEFDATHRDAIPPDADQVERARRTILRSFAGFGSGATNSAYRTGFRGTSSRSGTTPAVDWMHYPDQIDAFAARLKRVTVEHCDAIDVIVAHDRANTLFYVDPPYVHSTRSSVVSGGRGVYEYEMTDEQHATLAAVLRGVRGMVVLSGYRSAMYDDLYGDWTRLDRATHADGARDRVESLWLSPRASAALRPAFKFEEVGND